MAQSKQTSFEQEFNRLSFLASIATASSPSVTNSSSSHTQRFAQLSNPSSSHTQSLPHTDNQSIASISTGMQNGVIGKTLNNTNAVNIGRINSLLINSSNQEPQKRLPAIVRPRTYTPRGTRNTTQIQPPLPSSRRQQISSPRLQQISSPIMQQATPVSTENLKLFIAQQNANKSNVSTVSHTSNQPLSQQAKIYAQPSISSSTGQTILLPANLAGITGNVLIVNSPGQPPQAITLTPTTSKLQPSVATPKLQQIQQNIATTTTTIQQSIPTPLKQTKQNVRLQNGRTATYKAANKQQQLPQLQQIQPVSLSSFQNIRPKSFLHTIRNIQPKSSQVLTTSAQALKLSHFPSQAPVQHPTTVTVSNNILQNQTLVNSSIVSISVPSSFDQTMSQHLQTLEKTDPHLFPSQRTLQINQLQKMDQDKSVQSVLQISNDKKHSALQQPPKNITQQATANQIFQIGQPSSQYSSVSQQLALASHLHATTSSDTSLSKTAPINISFTTPQKQQASLQAILKQQLLQQQQQQQQQNKPLLQKLNQPSNIQQQQQQLQEEQTKQLLALQQQLLQQVQNQHKLNQQSNILQSKLEIKPQNSSLLQHVNGHINPPLKLLSNMVNPTSLAINPTPLPVNPTSLMVTKIAPTTASILQAQPVGLISNSVPNTLQQAIRPVLFQLSGGHLSSSVTPAQLIEIQKTLLTNQAKQVNTAILNQPKSLPNIINTSQSRISFQPSQSRQNFQSSHLVISTAAKVQNKSVFATHSGKPPVISQSVANQQILHQPITNQQITHQPITNQQITHQPITNQQVIEQQISNQQNFSPAASLKLQEHLAVNKALQEQLKHLSLAQREQILKQTINSTNTGSLSSSVLLASILQNKQTTAIKPLLKPNTTKGVAKGVKRAVDNVAREPEHCFSKRWKRLLTTDQTRFVSPDYTSPFSSIDDVISRLLPYHVGQEPENQLKDYRKHDILFHAFANNVQERKSWMIEKLNHLLLQESQIQWPSADDIMVGRLFLAAEQETFSQNKQALLEGRSVIVKSEVNNELRCTKIHDEEDLHEKHASSAETLSTPFLDNHLRIAHKDINNIDPEEEIEEDEDEEYMTEEITEPFYKEDNELAAATTNLLADLQQDDIYNLDFNF